MKVNAVHVSGDLQDRPKSVVDRQQPGDTSFSQAMARAEGSATGNGTPPPKGELPLEAYSLPRWYGDYLPEWSLYTPQINREFFSFAESLGSDGTISEGDRAAMRSYLDNDPGHQTQLRHSRLRAEFQSEFREYSNLLDDAFQAALKDSGITSRRDYYEKVIQTPGFSEQVHQSMVARLKDDPRAVELMEAMGVKGR